MLAGCYQIGGTLEASVSDRHDVMYSGAPAGAACATYLTGDVVCPDLTQLPLILDIIPSELTADAVMIATADLGMWTVDAPSAGT
jgi:hypothetical protein